MWKYTMVDKTTVEEFEADAETVERVIGIKIIYVNWVLDQDGNFGDGNWGVLVLQHSGDAIGTEDLFTKWNRARKR